MRSARATGRGVHAGVPHILPGGPVSRRRRSRGASEGNRIRGAAAGRQGGGVVTHPHRLHSAPPAVWGAVAVLVVWGLGRWGIVTHRPLWLLALVAAGASGLAVLGDRCFRIRPATPTMHIRVASQAVGVTVLLYLIGWGPALAVGFAFAILNNAFRIGSRSRWALMLWPILCLVVAQTLVTALGLHLLLAPRTADGLAAVDVVALVFTVLFVVRLVAGKEAAERQLAHAASHDELTGLMNRAAFTERLQRRLAGQRRGDRRERAVAVLFCDLVGFKAVNDRHGHDAGDRVLAEVARRLAATLRDGDLLARFAGDEFVVALSPIDGVGDAVTTAERLLQAFEWPMDLDGPLIRIGISVGIVYSPSGRASVEDMLADADAAMYDAKAAHASAWSLLEVA